MAIQRPAVGARVAVVQFFDQQDSENARNGTTVANEAELDALLAALAGREPFFFGLDSENGRTLTVGFGTDVGCVQFSGVDGVARIALSSEDEGKAGCWDFLCGGTATPVPRRYCLPMATVRELIAHFIRHWKPSPNVRWEFLRGPD